MAKQAVSGECREGRGKRGKVGGHTIWQSQTRVRFFDFCLATHTFWRLGADFRACSDSRFIRSSSFLIYYFQLFFYTLLLLASRKKLVTTRCLLSFHALPLALPSPPRYHPRCRLEMRFLARPEMEFLSFRSHSYSSVKLFAHAPMQTLSMINERENALPFPLTLFLSPFLMPL